MYCTVKATPYVSFRHNRLMTYSNSVKLKTRLTKGIRGTRYPCAHSGNQRPQTIIDLLAQYLFLSRVLQQSVITARWHNTHIPALGPKQLRGWRLCFQNSSFVQWYPFLCFRLLALRPSAWGYTRCLLWRVSTRTTSQEIGRSRITNEAD